MVNVKGFAAGREKRHSFKLLYGNIWVVQSTRKAINYKSFHFKQGYF